MSAPAWLDRQEYPFESHWLEVPAGRLHYIDEGEGEPLLMVHGNPSWSFMYRRQIRDLSSKYRCIALDHLGFGLSDKPADWSYLPKDHGENLGRLIEHLKLEKFHLQVHDWGGPIGLSQAIEYEDRVDRLIILNTWMWSLADRREARIFSGALGSAPARFAFLRFNAFARVVMPTAFYDKAKFRAVKEHYIEPFGSPKERRGAATFPREVIGSSEWLDSLWERRSAIVDKKALIVWALKDPVFRKDALERWQALLSDHRLERIPRVGHYVAEEMGSDLSELIDGFLSA